MAKVGTTPDFGGGKRQLWKGIAGTGDDAVVIETTDISMFDTFTLMSTAGAMDVVVSLDGTNFTTAPLSMADLGAVTTAPVIVTAAERMYGFRGSYRFIRVQQDAGVAVANARLMCKRSD